jgi:hypothetical protein
MRRVFPFLVVLTVAAAARARSTPNGSPGSAKLLTPITCAASSWAALGLARLAPKNK